MIRVSRRCRVPSTPEVQDVTPPEPKQAVTSQPDAKSSHETHHELGIAYLDAKMHTEAITEFKNAIDMDPDFTVAAYKFRRGLPRNGAT